jgi:hypothetical protein
VRDFSRAGAPLFFLAAIAASACGYRLGYVPRANLRTIAIPIAENESLRREVEFPLTEAIVREVQRRTPLIVADAGRADAVLRVVIARFEERVLVEGKDDEVLEAAARITLDVRLIDRRGREILRRRLDEIAEFPVSGNDRFATAAPDALERLAERVVMLLEEPPPGG